jgi:hypothetical protein
LAYSPASPHPCAMRHQWRGLEVGAPSVGGLLTLHRHYAQRVLSPVGHQFL